MTLYIVLNGLLLNVVMNIAAVTNLPDVSDFFPQINNDLSKITWGHAINNREQLSEALSKSSPIMMLEADVSTGHLNGTPPSSKPIPIMAHPPHTTSDLSLESWIQSVIKANQEGLRKGAKLDFKYLDIVLPSLEILKRSSSSITFPLWLNADILKGPGAEHSKPVDADIFLSLCTEFFPRATLSLGWTTSFKKGESLEYTDEMINKMTEAIDRNNINQPVNFPIRAAFVQKSLENLSKLHKKNPNATMTIWTSASDQVDLAGISSLQNNLGESFVYVDMPKEQKESIRKIRTESSSSTKRSNNFLLGSFATICLMVTSLLF